MNENREGSNLAVRSQSDEWPESAHRRHPTSNRAEHAFNLSETAPANTENDRDRERPEHQRGGGFFVAGDSPAFASRATLRSLNTTNKSRERNDEGGPLDCR
jgi:hypothetical protein